MDPQFRIAADRDGIPTYFLAARGAASHSDPNQSTPATLQAPAFADIWGISDWHFPLVADPPAGPAGRSAASIIDANPANPTGPQVLQYEQMEANSRCVVRGRSPSEATAWTIAPVEPLATGGALTSWVPRVNLNQYPPGLGSQGMSLFPGYPLQSGNESTGPIGSFFTWSLLFNHSAANALLIDEWGGTMGGDVSVSTMLGTLWNKSLGTPWSGKLGMNLLSWMFWYPMCNPTTESWEEAATAGLYLQLYEPCIVSSNGPGWGEGDPPATGASGSPLTRRDRLSSCVTGTRSAGLRALALALVASLIVLAVPLQELRGEDESVRRSAAPTTVAAAADELTRVIASADPEAVARVAEALRFDPWLVADELCSRGAISDAATYCAAAGNPACGDVGAFVERQRESPTTEERRSALVAAMRASAERRSEDVLRIIDSVDTERNDVVSVRLLHQRAIDLGRTGKSKESLRALLRLAARANTIGWPVRHALLLEYAAIQAGAMGDAGRSEELWLSAASAYHDVSSIAGEGRALNGLADVQRRASRMRDAIRTMRRAMPLLITSGDRLAQAKGWSMLAVCEHAVGDFAPAVTHHEAALRLFADVGVPTDRARAARDASRTYERLRDTPRALELLERALVLARGPRLGVLRGRILLERSLCCVRMNDSAGAVADAAEAARLFDSAESRVWYARAVGQLADILANTPHPSAADLDTSARNASRAIEIGQTLGERILVARGTRVLGDVARARGKMDEALVHWRAALAAARAAGRPEDEVLCIEQIVPALLARTGRDREALDLATSALRLRSRTLRGLGSDDAAALQGSGDRVWTIAAAAALRLADVHAWFETVELGRAASLTESLGGRSAIGTATVPARLEADVESAATELAEAAAALSAARESGKRSAVRAAIARESAARERSRLVQDRLERRRKLAAGLDDQRTPDVDALRQRLAVGEALIVYHLGTPGGTKSSIRIDELKAAVALVVRREGAAFARLGGTDAVVAACDALRIAHASSTDVTDAARKVLIDPLKLDDSIKSLIILPAGPIATVPFGALVPDLDVTLVPSARVWMLLDDNEGDLRGEGVLAVGNPDYSGRTFAALPATEAEAEAVGTTVLIGRDATEPAFRAAVAERPRWKALHFACHGVVDERHASLSGLVLTRSEADDGVLTAREIIGMSLPADLAFLSACEAGRPGATSAAQGLPGALLAAGCPRVVANVWKVDDEAASAFAQEFHRLWQTEGMTAARALREARNTVRKDPKHSDPRKWAGWVLWGLPD